MTLSFVSTKIIQATISLSNPVVGAISNYIFTVNNTNIMAANSQLLITFPNGYNINGLTCLYNGTIAANYSVTATTATITIPTSMSQNALASIPFAVVGVTNLYSLMPSPTFYL
jgi:hypothetical protein